MIIKNVTVETTHKYLNGSYAGVETQSYLVKLSIPLPGGVAIYELTTSKAQNDSIEQASKLSGV